MDYSEINELARNLNEAALQRLIAASLTSGLLSPDMTARQAVEKYEQVLAALREE